MEEKSFKPISGYVVLFGLVVVVVLAFVCIVNRIVLPVPFLALIALVLVPGFFFVNPNDSRVLTLFGDYKGSTKDNGFFWANPFFYKKRISLRARNFESERVKVNDKRGNPIMISVITVWRVQDSFKAVYEVDDYVQFVKLQSDAAVRNLVGSYSYDNMEDDEELTLRSGHDAINTALELALKERLDIAGIEVMEARIGYLAYAEEIAQAMLKRQQAEAIVAARFKIVEGAVSMVEMALAELSKKQIIELDEDKKAQMVSNLMVILCSDKDVSPVVNAGTVY